MGQDGLLEITMLLLGTTPTFLPTLMSSASEELVSKVVVVVLSNAVGVSTDVIELIGVLFESGMQDSDEVVCTVVRSANEDL